MTTFLSAAGNSYADIDISGFSLQPDDFLVYVGAFDNFGEANTPSGWTTIATHNAFQSFWTLAWKKWSSGDSTTVPNTAHAGEVFQYRGVDYPSGNPIADEADGTNGFVSNITVPVDNSLIVEFAYNFSLSTFTFDTPPGETIRASNVSGGFGYGYADTSTDTAGTRSPTTWTHASFPPPGTTTTAIFAVHPAPTGGGWGVGVVRMGSN